MLTTLLMAEEKSAILTKAREEADKEYEPRSGSRRPSEEAEPVADPEWDPNSLEGKEKSGHFQSLLLKARQEVSRPPTNWSK